MAQLPNAAMEKVDNLNGSGGQPDSFQLASDDSMAAAGHCDNWGVNATKIYVRRAGLWSPMLELDVQIPAGIAANGAYPS